MTNALDYYKIKEEMVVFLRNNDVFTTSVRGVTTTADTGSWSSTSTHLINKSNVRNIRSITVDASPLTYKTDYTVDYYYNDSGTRKCQITLTNPQTGSYNISYDYGTDKIYPDYPQTTLNIDDFPRIGVDVISVDTEEGALGNVNLSAINYSVTIYSTSKTNILNYLTTIRTKIIDNQLTFKYLGNYVKPTGSGPLLVYENGKDKVFQQTIDLQAPHYYEIN